MLQLLLGLLDSSVGLLQVVLLERLIRLLQCLVHLLKRLLLLTLCLLKRLLQLLLGILQALLSFLRVLLLERLARLIQLLLNLDKGLLALLLLGLLSLLTLRLLALLSLRLLALLSLLTLKLLTLVLLPLDLRPLQLRPDIGLRGRQRRRAGGVATAAGDLLGRFESEAHLIFILAVRLDERDQFLAPVLCLIALLVCLLRHGSRHQRRAAEQHSEDRSSHHGFFTPVTADAVPPALGRAACS